MITDAIVVMILASSLAGNVQLFRFAQRLTKLEMLWQLTCPSCDIKQNGKGKSKK